jgi:DNA repair exonuclease SbcCD ATPase subunit
MQVEISPAAKALETEAQTALESARNYPIIASNEDYQSADAELSRLSAKLKDIEAERVKLKAPILDAGRRIDDFFKRPAQFLEDARKAIKARMLTWQQELQRQRDEAERIAREAARKEQERLRAEAAKAEEAARKQREAAEAKARALEAAGNAERAEAARIKAEEAERARMQRAEELRRAAEMMPSAPVVSIAQPESASSVRKSYDFEVIDEKAIPREYLIVDEKAIRKVVKALGARANIAGIRVIEVQSIASGRG